MPLAVCSDLSPADWIVASDIPWTRLVTIGPAGFAAYARGRFIPDPIGTAVADLWCPPRRPTPGKVLFSVSRITFGGRDLGRGRARGCRDLGPSHRGEEDGSTPRRHIALSSRSEASGRGGDCVLRAAVGGSVECDGVP